MPEASRTWFIVKLFLTEKNAILDEITFCASSIFHTSWAIFSLIWTNFCRAYCALVYLYLLHLTELTGSYRNRKETCQYLYLHIFFLSTLLLCRVTEEALNSCICALRPSIQGTKEPQNMPLPICCLWGPLLAWSMAQLLFVFVHSVCYNSSF